MSDERNPQEELTDSDFDIDSALASVASLSDALAEQEALEEAELQRLEAEAEAIEAEQIAREQAEQAQSAYVFTHPPMLILQRGYLASVVPALLLIFGGAWLTFALTSATVTWTALATSVAAASGLSLLGYWLTTGRWAQGALFGGLALLLNSGLLVYLAQSDVPGADGWPLLLTGVGLALAASAVLAPPLSRHQFMTGAVLIVAGLAGLALTTEALGQEMTDVIRDASPAILVALLVVFLLPLVARRA
jgi:hypothetical protein